MKMHNWKTIYLINFHRSVHDACPFNWYVLNDIRVYTNVLFTGTNTGKFLATF
jgi:hypothetical protein